MSTKSVELNFPSQTSDQWREAARQELDGTDPFEKLTVTKADIAIKPYYDANDRTEFRVLPIAVSQNEFLGARAWANMPKVIVENAKKANEEALNHLNHGADGVLFDLHESKTDVHKLLDRIELPYCSVSFLADTTSQSFFEDFKVFAEKKFDKKTITGSVFWKHEAKAASLFADWPQFHGLGIMVEEKNNPSTEIAEAVL
jgi:hypothetical protein